MVTVFGVPSSLSVTTKFGTVTSPSVPGFSCSGSLTSPATGLLLIPKFTSSTFEVTTVTSINPSFEPSVPALAPTCSPSSFDQFTGKLAVTLFSCVLNTTL